MTTLILGSFGDLMNAPDTSRDLNECSSATPGQNERALIREGIGSGVPFAFEVGNAAGFFLCYRPRLTFFWGFTAPSFWLYAA